jgi:RNA polymerase sigma factor (sigma-70 family)
MLIEVLRKLKIINIHKNQTQLIEEASKNSRQAQHVLYQTFAPKMLSVCRMYIKDNQQAEEALLDGFFKVFTHINDFKNQGSFEGWVRRIMVRQCIDNLRKNSKIDFHDEITDGNVKHNEIQWKYDTQHIQQAIDELPEGYKMVFNLFAIEGYKHDEIATMLKITEGTSKSQLHKARKLLQDKLKDYKSTSNGK